MAIRACVVASLVLTVAATVIRFTEPANGSVPFSWAQQPLGNGLLAAGVWVEPPNHLVAYLSSPTAYNELHQLVKIGRIRLSLELASGSGPVFAADGFRFDQSLWLANGTMSITGAGGVSVDLWMERDRPVLHVVASSADGPLAVRASTELYRLPQADGRIPADVGGDWICLAPGVPAPRVSGDLLVPRSGGGVKVAWLHRNRKTDGVLASESLWESECRLQHLNDLVGRPQITNDTLTNNTFGASLVATAGSRSRWMGPDSEVMLVEPSDPGGRSVSIAAVSLETTPSEAGTVEQYVDALSARADQVAGMTSEDLSLAWEAQAGWWSEYFNHSYVRVTGTATPKHNAELITMQSNIQRYLSAVEGRGTGIIKFNGGLFHPDPPVTNNSAGMNADTRQWGGATWFQNTRHSYWPMLASGDWEQLQPLFEFYRKALPLAEARTRITMLHEGAYFPETMWQFGTWTGTNFGCPAYREKVGPLKNSPRPDNSYIRHYRTQGLELSTLMLEALAHAPSEFGGEFARHTIIPIVVSVLRFFNEHYELSSTELEPGLNGGKMVMRSQALETCVALSRHRPAWDRWQECINPTTDVAGLQWVVSKALALSTDLLPSDSEARAMIETLKSTIPTMDQVTTGGPGARHLAYCEFVAVHNYSNVENVRLPIRPQVAINTYHRRLFHNPIATKVGPSVGEWQEGPQAARLGLAEEAADSVQLRAGWGGVTTGPYSAEHDGAPNHYMRFPGFFGPLDADHNSFPDTEHLATLRTTLQWMLIQNDGDRILLFGGLPRGWDVEFKLHARHSTVIEGECRGGRLVRMSVQPAARAKDVVIVGEACK